MLTKVQKSKIIDELADKIKDKKMVVFSDFTGLNVQKVSTLRRLLKKEKITYKVIKKSLLKIALEKAGFADVKIFDGFKGSCAVIIDFEKEVIAPQIITKFAKKKENDGLKIIGGLLENSVLNKAEVVKLALVPSREVLLGQLAFTVAYPISSFMNVLNGNTKKLIFALQQIQAKKS